ncbi:hypothetical protein BC938DRAFT_476771 [Jimgerdemannia flammicorona]|uniref:Uncharacterized protein n=1 Tax=Jimgerdemannia flammicorona TaxID=994334 RepID=A0A433QQ39_9FUNG|nr:hypothetical protein BC938DRAFT_476771 [Jimgerdemannia flammicorona]
MSVSVTLLRLREIQPCLIPCPTPIALRASPPPLVEVNTILHIYNFAISLVYFDLISGFFLFASPTKNRTENEVVDAFGSSDMRPPRFHPVATLYDIRVRCALAMRRNKTAPTFVFVACCSLLSIANPPRLAAPLR